ncbi:MAG: Na+/H+ antiporter NhaC family protein, partial [Ignavibacteriaceae bacterium]
IIEGWNPFNGMANAIQACVNVFKDEGNTRVIIFSALVGALISLTQISGGVQGFIDLIHKKKLVNSRRQASVLSFFVGCSVFIESSISCLVTGTIFHPIFEKFKISREKLAYICDTTSSPICILIPLNAWGAYVIGLLSKENITNPIPTFFSTIPLNFYPIIAVILAGFIAFTYKDFSAMKKAEKRSLEKGKTIADGAVPVITSEISQLKPNAKIPHVTSEISQLKPKAKIPHRAVNMIIPILTMISMMPVSLLITGNGNLTAGSGSTSVLWSVAAAIAVSGILSIGQKILTLHEVMEYILKGIGGLIPLAILMVFAFAIGDTCRTLGTGTYVASVADKFLNPNFVAPIIFTASMFIAFSTGTSWGTFAIMIPIAVPIAQVMDINLSLAIASVLSGSVFGDHCSPISDTTIISSMASASDHIDHVRTQLPYALTSAILSLILFTLFGFIL